jgi:hypothetical protein
VGRREIPPLRASKRRWRFGPFVAPFATQGKQGKRDDKIGGRGRSNVCHPEGMALHLNLFDFFGDTSGEAGA